MTAPAGVLEWGQAQTYNGKDDRIVITALANGQTGIVKAATFAAGSGLTMTVGAFTAIVSCGDATLCVAASLTSQTVTLVAGPGSGSRIDIVWLDIDPAAGTWQINLRAQADTVGRLGIKLGQVTMPQNSNLATQATLTPSPASWAPFPQPVTPATVSLVRSGAISVATATNVVITGGTNGWQSEETGAAATLWNNGGFIAPAAGIYLVAARCMWAVSLVGFRACSLLRNGALLTYSETRLLGQAPSPALYSTSIMPAYPVKCAAGDVITMQVYQTSGGALSTVQIQMTVCQQS